VRLLASAQTDWRKSVVRWRSKAVDLSFSWCVILQHGTIRTEQILSAETRPPQINYRSVKEIVDFFFWILPFNEVGDSDSALISERGPRSKNASLLTVDPN